VLLVPPQSSRVDDQHRVYGWVHQAEAPASVAVTRVADFVGLAITPRQQ
jgi:hypothetical protein